MSPLGWFHTLCAVVALVSGAFVVGMRKGTANHVQIGYIYVGSMVALNVTALMIYRLFGGFGPFHIAAIFSLIGLIVAILPAILRRPRKTWLTQHYYGMSWSYVGLIAAAASEFITRVPATVFWWGVLGATAGVVVIGGTIIKLRAQRTIDSMRRI